MLVLILPLTVENALPSLLLLGSGLLLLEFLWGWTQLPNMRCVPPAETSTWPSISILIAARNEEATIEAGLSSLLKLDYDALEIVVVNDRSEDRTAEVIARMAAKDSRIVSVSVDTLPAGWLGKNHAMMLAALKARGEWLLMTDADVIFDPTLLKRAVTLIHQKQKKEYTTLDHLVLFPSLTSPDPKLRMFLVSFALFFNLYARPWWVPFRWTPFAIGVGAFNMIKRSVYIDVKGHQTISMRPDEDMRLGHLIKSRGYRQQAALSDGLVSVDWYPNLPALVEGLMKNAFAGLNYSIPFAVASILSMGLFFVWPFAGMLLWHGVTGNLYFLTCITLVSLCAVAARWIKLPVWGAFALPVSTLLMIWILTRATIQTLKHQGISWRGTFYSLEMLKHGRPEPLL